MTFSGFKGVFWGGSLLIMVVVSGCSGPNEKLADAVAAGDMGTVKAIVTRHPDSVSAVVDLNDIGTQTTELHLAVNNQRYAVARYLVSKGARLDVVDSLDQTPLESAVAQQDLKMSGILLDAGASPNHRGSFSATTALHIAAGAGDKALVKLLLSYGADPSITDKSGKTPVSYARENGSRDVAELMTSSRTTRPSAK